ncbi:glycosyltransferase family 1 protein [Rufibacter glacialis]|uniref:Glycosyltransferase family 1 protein n=1 Tax=Rufibacter glacialis TaxID=1259555 RepID=A0A5M8QQM0_9BACT|nr:glycosyltransferase family 1 protein [Rufibacter glacialis]KAA6437340.1 glycosyltransferase family 1 protein [Rufibacter glacialis]GGK60100.1 glycosyl transferase [Rufibacter glacialis]
MFDLDSDFIPGVGGSSLSSEPEVSSSSTYSSSPSDTTRTAAKQGADLSLEAYLSTVSAIICLSHLRWDFVYQRPQHLLSRFAKHTRLFFFEEPYFSDNAQPRLEMQERENGRVTIVVAHLPHGLTPEESDAKQVELLNAFMADHDLTKTVFWYYTPMALEISRQFNPALTVFDCMDELSAFKFAPPRLLELEAELMTKADVVFTGGQSLYEAKVGRHKEVYAFPSSIDKVHFGQARQAQEDPADQANIPHPRMGFFGVVDERFDIELLREVALARPEWQFVIIGPVVKIDPAILPSSSNIHYLGGKSYQELPSYLAGWDVAMLLFAHNESTKYISPTKTPEYLAAGRPVVSTSIRDVVRPYGEQNLVHIADGAEAFEAALVKALAQKEDKDWRRRTDDFLAGISWDKTWQNMVRLMQSVAKGKSAKEKASST